VTKKGEADGNITLKEYKTLPFTRDINKLPAAVLQEYTDTFHCAYLSDAIHHFILNYPIN